MLSNSSWPLCDFVIATLTPSSQPFDSHDRIHESPVPCSFPTGHRACRKTTDKNVSSDIVTCGPQTAGLIAWWGCWLHSVFELHELFHTLGGAANQHKLMYVPSGSCSDIDSLSPSWQPSPVSCGQSHKLKSLVSKLVLREGTFSRGAWYPAWSQ